MSLTAGRNRIEYAMRDLMIKWAEATEKWDDVKAREIHDRHLILLEPKVRAALAAMEKMEDLLAKAKRDCGAG